MNDAGLLRQRRHEDIYMLDPTSIMMTCSWLSKGLNDFSREFYESTIPAMDIYESEDGNELIVKIDLPGFAKKDIVLSIDEDILRIRAKREPEEESRLGSIYYKQRPRQIDKKIILPISLQDGQKVAGAAVYIDGVITIRIPTVQPKNIQIL
jgi:HSP20 family protein